MALLDNVFKQRMVGALVLVALAVIFLPMLFSREDELRQVRVEAPAAPSAPVVPPVQVAPVTVPQAQALPQESVPDDADVAEEAPSTPVTPVPAAPAPAVSKPRPKPAPVASAPARPVTAPAVAMAATPSDTAQSKIDGNGLPISWSVQLASLSSRASADSLQKTLRTQGYNAYIRSSEGMNRVFVGPLIEHAEAERLRDLLGRQNNLRGFVVHFQPERG